MATTATTTKTLFKLTQCLEEFRKLDEVMSMQTAMCFLYVALKPGIPMKDLSEAIGLSQAACSRNVAALSEWHRFNSPGHNLVKAEIDPTERRRKRVYLTERGRRIATSLSLIIDPELASPETDQEK